MASDPAIIEPPANDPPANDPPASDPPVANDPPAQDPPASDPPADPPKDDWRALLAGDDEKLLGFLGRYQSPKAFAEAAKKDRDAARSALKPLSDKPSDEELAAYRKNFGVPEKPEGYLEKLPDGLVVGDDDRPFVDTFLSKMHEANAPKAAVDQALSAYYEIVEEQLAVESENAANAKRASEDALRDEWGADYRRNLNAMHGHLDTLPEAVKTAFMHGKGPDGVPLGYNADVLKWLTGLALEANPLATVVPGAGANQASAIAEEIAAIEKTMRTNRAEYNKDEKLQARYRELLTAREKLK